MTLSKCLVMFLVVALMAVIVCPALNPVHAQEPDAGWYALHKGRYGSISRATYVDGYVKFYGPDTWRGCEAQLRANGLLQEEKARPDLPDSLSPSYYMVVYAAQDRGNIPVTSHCFATFARVAPMGESSRGRAELHHINWFSIRGHQTGLANLTEPDGRSSHPEPGENRTTHEALSLVHRHGLRITRWGPYEIDQRLFERAQRQIDLLEGRVPERRVLYKVFDLGYREGPSALAVNCIHAVSDIDREHTPLRTWASYGDEAARKIVLHLRRWIQEPVVENPGTWELIWEATWQGVPVPAGLEVIRGEPPWPTVCTQTQGREKGHH